MKSGVLGFAALSAALNGGAAYAQVAADVEAVVVVGRDYRVTALASVTKTDTAILHIPQPVHVITAQVPSFCRSRPM